LRNNTVTEKKFKKRPVNIRHIKNWLLGIFGLLIILSAISFTLLRVAIKSMPDYKVLIQELASERTGMKIEVGSLDAEIYWLLPRLNLLDVKVSDATGEKLFLRADELILSLDWLGSMQTMMPVVGEIVLSGVDIKIGINKQSQLLVQNYVVHNDINKQLQDVNIGEGEIPVSFKVNEEIKYIVNNLNVNILNSNFEFYDERDTHRNKKFENFSLHLFNNSDEHVFEMKASLPGKYGEDIHLIIDVNGNLFDYTELNGEVYLSVNDIQAAPWLDDYWDYFQLTASGKVNAQLWLSWNAQEITAVQSQLGLTDIVLSYLDTSVNTWKLDKLDAGVQWEKNDTGWQLDVRDLTVVRDGVVRTESSSATVEMVDASRELNLRADFLRIESLVYMAGMGNSFFDKELPWLDFLEKHKPSGRLEQLDASLPMDEPEDIKVNTRFNHISFDLPDSEPSMVHNLQGTVTYRDSRTWLTLESENTQLKFNKLFRNSLVISTLKGTLEILHKDHTWSFSTHSLQIDTPHISTVSRMRFIVPEKGNAFLDLTNRFKNGDGEYLGLYLPAGIIDAGTVEWLDSSISKGRIVKGGYQFYGNLNDAPFYKKQGISLADFNVTGFNVSYLDDWPAINNIDAHLRVENDTVLITGKSAAVLNSEITGGRVYIDSFSSPTLDFKGEIETQLGDLKGFVQQSSLRDQVTDYINNVELSGQGKLDLELFLPLYGDYRTEWGGELRFKEGKLKLVKEDYTLTDLQGAVRFAGDTVESRALTGRMDGKLINIDVKTAQQQKDLSYAIGVQGNFSVASLLGPAPELQGLFNGDADWDIRLDIRPSNARRKTEIEIKVASDLKGVSSDLPGKLGKLAAEVIALDMNINIQSDTGIRYDLKLNESMHISLTDKNSQWFIGVDDESVKGKAVYNPAASIDAPLNIELEYLDLNNFLEYPAPGAEVVVDGDVEESNEVNEEADLFVASPGSSSILSPADIPSLRLSAKSLLWKKFRFSRAELKTRQTNLGMIIESLDLVSSDYSVSATGNWLSGWNNKNTTKLDADIVIGDLGKVFKQLELSDNLSQARGGINIGWQWQGAPYELDWGRLRGSANLSLKAGTIKKLDAGIGRLLGLLNFETLLTMDFGSQVSEGFSFDKVKSKFEFSRGNVHTSNFLIKSKAADISMNGFMDIENELLDLKVTVVPNLDSTLSLGTAFVAGPTVGGLVYLFQKVFNTSSLSAYQYTVKGKVDDPKVEVLSVPRTEDDEDEFDF